MDRDNLYPDREEQGLKEERNDVPHEMPQDEMNGGIYKEGAHQNRGEYRDPEADFRKEPYQQETYRQGTYQQIYQEPGSGAYRPAGEGFGIASLALGIASMVLFCSCLNIPLAILAIVFGIIQITKPSGRKGLPAGGIVTAVISLIAFVVFLIVLWGSTDFREGLKRGLELQRGLEYEDRLQEDIPEDHDDWGGEDWIEDPFEDEIPRTF